MLSSHLDINEYNYPLPAEKIAQFPVSPRDSSKLLVLDTDKINHRTFSDLPQLLPSDALLVYNNTKVIPARLLLQSETGAHIEVLVLEPFEVAEIQVALQQQVSVIYTCMVGNKKKWKEDQDLQFVHSNFILKLKWINRENNVIEFSWEPSQLVFAEILAQIGAIPLPPYMTREAEVADSINYQTIYAAENGAVAAPTAGLHFTDEVFAAIEAKGIKQLSVTLHVGAGTFLPVKTENAIEHKMHEEQFVVTKQAIETIINHQGPVIAVGTTSVRTLESLYWLGVKIANNSNLNRVEIGQFEPYEKEVSFTGNEALSNLLNWMKENNTETLIGETQIMIVPGYQFKVVDALVTNFHQPASTLMLLVSAFIGEQWKAVYESALSNNYRFLSYGDSSLLIPKPFYARL
jgi:S-adenosylmethionine:tRNA ribosyltransferase-isomerase